MIRGKYQRPVVPSETPGLERLSPKQVRPIDPDEIEIPSPYLDGTLDSFLDEGLVPIVQTMRGCPYQCHFCVSGATEWNRMRGFDPQRVKAEIDYAMSRSGSKDLILTDENWGILGDRDIEIASYITEREQDKGRAQSGLLLYGKDRNARFAKDRGNGCPDCVDRRVQHEFPVAKSRYPPAPSSARISAWTKWRRMWNGRASVASRRRRK